MENLESQENQIREDNQLDQNQLENYLIELGEEVGESRQALLKQIGDLKKVDPFFSQVILINKIREFKSKLNKKKEKAKTQKLGEKVDKDSVIFSYGFRIPSVVNRFLKSKFVLNIDEFESINMSSDIRKLIKDARGTFVHNHLEADDFNSMMMQILAKEEIKETYTDNFCANYVKSICLKYNKPRVVSENIQISNGKQVSRHLKNNKMIDEEVIAFCWSDYIVSNISKLNIFETIKKQIEKGKLNKFIYKHLRRDYRVGTKDIEKIIPVIICLYNLYEKGNINAIIYEINKLSPDLIKELNTLFSEYLIGKLCKLSIDFLNENKVKIEFSLFSESASFNEQDKKNVFSSLKTEKKYKEPEKYEDFVKNKGKDKQSNLFDYLFDKKKAYKEFNNIAYIQKTITTSELGYLLRKMYAASSLKDISNISFVLYDPMELLAFLRTMKIKDIDEKTCIVNSQYVLSVIEKHGVDLFPKIFEIVQKHKTNTKDYYEFFNKQAFREEISKMLSNHLKSHTNYYNKQMNPKTCSFI
ncbi:MAG: hypothetical protein N4A49_06480 [Marinifilaceae bacterium]|jgi:hypothetical protein|nr:hypothetical protein [Marinifilaceae bacterium]